MALTGRGSTGNGTNLGTGLEEFEVDNDGVALLHSAPLDDAKGALVLASLQDQRFDLITASDSGVP